VSRELQRFFGGSEMLLHLSFAKGKLGGQKGA